MEAIGEKAEQLARAIERQEVFHSKRKDKLRLSQAFWQSEGSIKKLRIEYDLYTKLIENEEQIIWGIEKELQEELKDEQGTV